MAEETNDIIFKCSHCGATLKVQGSAFGKQGICPGCNQKVTVPEKSIEDDDKENK